MPPNDIPRETIRRMLRNDCIRARVDELLKFFQQPNFDVDFKNDTGETALHVAVSCKAFEVAKALLDKGASANLADDKKNTPLMLTARDEKDGIKIARLLLEVAGVELCARDCMGRTSLHVAADYNNHDVAKALLQKKVDINAQDRDGKTALMIAVENQAVETAELLLQYGALRGSKDAHGTTALDTVRAYAQDTNAWPRQRAIVKRFSQVLCASHAKELCENSLQILHQPPTRTMRDFTTIWWLFSRHPSNTASYDRLARHEAENFSWLLKDSLVTDVLEIVEDAQSFLSPEPGSSYKSTKNFDPSSDINSDSDKDSDSVSERLKCTDWVWIHVPSNNILWIRWAIQHLPASYQMTDGVNLFGVIDLALAEVQKSPTCRPIHCTQIGDVTSVVMPFLMLETEELISSRQDLLRAGDPRAVKNLDSRLGVMQELANKYGHHSRNEDSSLRVLHVPQTLDQSYFALDEPSTGLDTDQVMYRYTKTPKQSAKQHSLAKLLVVNQLWLWKIGDLVVTAFSEPWTTVDQDEAYQPLILSLDDPTRGSRIRKSGDLVEQVLAHCVEFIDRPSSQEPGHPETWELVFAKSIAALRRRETERYKDFSDYLNLVIERRNLDIKPSDTNDDTNRRFMALYDISPETEGLRQVRDIRDELRMIEKVLRDQTSVVDSLVGAIPNRSSEVVCQKLGLLRRFDTEAQEVEIRFNQLLDFKQKQGSLILAKDADKRDKEGEKQSQLLFAFTVITVIFTPLNFIAAFMAIPTSEYPHFEGNINWKWWQTFVGMLITEIISVPTVYFWVKSTDLAKLFTRTKKPFSNAEILAKSHAPTPGLKGLQSV